MGNFRFYKRVHLFPGLSVNLSKSGPSLTVGMRGAHLTVGRSGVRRTIGIPGSGMYYTSHKGHHTGFHSAHVETPVAPAHQAAVDFAAQGAILLIALGVALLVGVAIGKAMPGS
jgi:hypothetical protein